MPAHLNANRDFAQNGGNRQVLRHPDCGAVSRVFSVDALHGLDLAFAASSFRHKFMLGQVLKVKQRPWHGCAGGSLSALRLPHRLAAPGHPPWQPLSSCPLMTMGAASRFASRHNFHLTGNCAAGSSTHSGLKIFIANRIANRGEDIVVQQAGNNARILRCNVGIAGTGDKARRRPKCQQAGHAAWSRHGCGRNISNHARADCLRRTRRKRARGEHNVRAGRFHV
jgi:hypothetical protein